MKRSNTLYLDQEDCKGFTVGEEVTLLRWGNFIIDEVVKDASGVITTVKSRHNAEATNFSKTKKATWLAVTPGTWLYTDVDTVVVLIQFSSVMSAKWPSVVMSVNCAMYSCILCLTLHRMCELYVGRV